MCGRDFINKEKGSNNQWFSSKLLHTKATRTAICLGCIQWVKKNPLATFTVLNSKTKKQRHSLTCQGKRRQSKSNQVYAKRENEPWLLVATLSLKSRTPKQIVKNLCHTNAN